LFITLGICIRSLAQDEYIWWNPAQSSFPIVEGQAWPGEVQSKFDRLPARSEKMVRTQVWHLSHDAAGLMIPFMTSAPQIVVRYKVTKEIAFDHMPATGVSGVDLYAINSDGKWLWSSGSFSFGDTIIYTFKGLDSNDAYHKKGRIYNLYLPLYNSVSWMEIGVPKGSAITPLPLRKDRPIVIYGTSIVQGGCTSRPGMAWPAILGRRADRTVINLGFGGNGLLEKELINLLAEIDAKIYVLDCLPNLATANLSQQEIRDRIIASVKMLQAKRKDVPILFVEHAGYSDELINAENRMRYTGINKLMKDVFNELIGQGTANLYLITKEELNLGMDDMVDGIHPTDLGMLHYADAVEKVIRTILHEPTGTITTTIPCTQNRDASIYNWRERHNELLSLNSTRPPGIIFIGNSITHYWGGEPTAPISRGSDSWNKFFTPLGTTNFGFGWDRIENVLWRVYHDELDGYHAREVVMLIGTNNLQLNTDSEIIEGLKMLVQAIQYRQPTAKILLLGLLPRRHLEDRISTLNKKISGLASSMHIMNADAGRQLLDKNGKIDESLFADGLHPNAQGYAKMVEMLREWVR
jgi:lysophospholipase L1-like esterase